MTENAKIKIFYHVIQGDYIHPSVQSVLVGRDMEIAALRKVILTKEAVSREDDISIWKPSRDCPHKHAEFVKYFERHNKTLDDFCEDVTHDDDRDVLGLFDLPQPPSPTVVVTIKPLNLRYLVIKGDVVYSNAEIDVSPNHTLEYVIQHITTTEKVVEHDVDIWKPPQDIPLNKLKRRLSQWRINPHPLLMVECENLTDDLDRSMSGIFNLARSPITLVVVIPGEIELSYHAVETVKQGRAPLHRGSVKFDLRDSVDRVRGLIAEKENGASERDVVIWKPREPLSDSQENFSRLFSEKNHDLARFCDNLTDTCPSRSMWDLFRPIESHPTTLVITMPSTELRYFVLLAGEPHPPCRTVQVGFNDSVHDLRRRIATNLNELAREEDTITILKPRKKISSSYEDFHRLCSIHNNDPTKFCNDLMDTSDSCATLLEIKGRHNRAAAQPILVVTVWESSEGELHTTEAEDVLAELTKRFERICSSKYDTPSNLAKPGNYVQHQKTDLAILDGRYADGTIPSYAPPVVVYHPVFARFAARTRHDSLPPLGVALDSYHDDVVKDPAAELTGSALAEFLIKTFDFMCSASRTNTRETTRTLPTRDYLQVLVRRPVNQMVNANRTSPDHVIFHPITDDRLTGTAALAIVEEKAELGESSDPSVQSGVSFIHHWKSQEDLRTQCFCPSFLIAIAGPHISVCGAIMTANVVVQRLTPYYWIGHSSVIDTVDNVSRVARLFYALRLGLDELEQWYNEVPPALKAGSELDIRKRIFPLATCCVLRDGTKVKFRYLEPFKRAAVVDPGCVAFLVVREDNQEKAVIKFVERYNTEAHELLAARGFAPKLLSIGPVWVDDELAQRGCGSRKMVMMEYVEGKPCMEVYGRNPIPKQIVGQVRKALELLHSHDMVHGDIRRRNILVENSQNLGEERVKIVDFDWAGKIGTVNYPLDLNTTFPWAKGVKAGRAIEVSHDDEMCNRLSTKEK